MPSSDLTDELAALSQDQLNTITFETGVDQSGAIVSTSYWGGTAHSWQTALGAGASNVTYQFETSTDNTTFTQPAQSAAVQALALWSDLANISFMAYDGNEPLNVAFELAGKTYGKTTVPAGTSYDLNQGGIQPTSTPGLSIETFGTLQFDNSGSYGVQGVYNDSSDGYGVSALVHEVGHLLGLGHSGNYNFVQNGPTDFGPQAFNATDVRTWSTMSYIDPRDTTDKYHSSFGPEATDWLTPGEKTKSGQDIRAPYTPMGMDIFAAQRLYGAPTNGVLGGGQIFGFNCNIMYADPDGTEKPLSMWNFATSADGSTDMDPVVTLYDYGTGNTLDLSGFTLSSSVQLTSGGWTSADGMINNIFIEYGTQIDTAIGGTGDDVFWLNADGDTINGGAGNNSAYLLGTSADYTMSGSGPNTTYTEIATGAVNTLTNVQNVYFVSDTWIGDAGGDDFNTAGNWSTGALPDTTDNMGIPDHTTVNYSGDQTTTVDSVQISQQGTLQIDQGHFIITDGAESSSNLGIVEVNAAGTEVSLILGGTFVNDGQMFLQGPDEILLTNDDTVTIGGTGTIDMILANIGGRGSNNATPFDTFVSSNLIHGSGIIGRDLHLNTLNVVNMGTIQADDVAPLTIQSNVVNQGLLSGDSKNASLVLTATIDNTAGTITAQDGATVELSDATVTGGQINAIGTGKIEISGNSKLDGSNPAVGGSPAGIALSGAVVVDDGTALTVAGAVTGGAIDGTKGQVLLDGAQLTGVKLTGKIGFGASGGATLYSAGYYALSPTDIGGISLGSGELTLAPDPLHGDNGFANSGTFTIGKGAILNIYQTAGIEGGLIKMTDPGAVITGTPGGGGYQPYDWLVLDNATVSGVGIIAGLEIWSTTSSTIMATGGTLIVASGSDLDYRHFPEETVSDGWIGAAAGSDLVIMGILDLQPNIIDGSSPGGSLYGAGTITLGGSIITGAKAGTIVGGSIDAGRTIQVAAPGGGLDQTTVNGEIDVNAGALLTLFGGEDVNQIDNPGTETNNGLIVLNGALDGNSVYQAATLTTLGDVYVNGSGTIRLESNGGTGDDQIVSVANNDTLDNGGTIEGVGTLGGSYLNLFNDGVVDADATGHTLVVNGGSLNGTAGLIYNDGLMQATNGGTLLVNSAIANYGLGFFDPFDFPNGVPTGGGDIGASGPNSVVLLNNGGITAGRLFTEGGGRIEITGNATLGAGPVLIPQGTATPLGDTDTVINSNTNGRQSDGAVAGLSDGRIVVAWADYSANANGPGTPDPVTGAILYPPIVRFTVMGAFGTRLTAGDLAVQPPAAGQQQTDPRTAALSGGGFIITWLQSSLGGGGITLQGVTFNKDLSPNGSGFSIPISGSGSAVQNVAGMKDGGFAVVWADAASAGTASPIHLQRFTQTGVGGTVVNLGTGVQPGIALAGNGTGAYAVTWTVPGAGNAEGTVYAQFFSAAGVAAGAPVTVATGNSAYIAPGQNGNAFVVFWSDPAGHPGILQGQEFQSNGQLSGIGINTAAELDYGGLFTASSGALPDGRVATAQNLPRNGSVGYTDVGLQFSATHANNYALVSYANITVDSGHSLTLQQGMANDGTIVLSSNGGAVLNASGSVTVNGVGTIVLGNPTDQIRGATGADTLINQGSTIMGQGSIGGNKLGFTNQGIVSATTGTLAIGGGTLINNSTMKSAGGALVINGPIFNEGYIESTGSNGKVVINGPVQDKDFFSGYLEVLGGEVDLNGSVDVGQYIYFSSSEPGLLVLSDPSQMKGNILFMNVGDTIDVTGVAATSFNYDPNGGNSGNGVLNLMSGATTLASLGLQGTAYPGSLIISSDNHGGTLVELASTTSLGNGVNASVAGLPGGGFVEIYQYSPGVGDPPGAIYGTLYDANQNYAGFLYIDGTGQQPTVTAQRSGNFMVAWANTATNTIQAQIYSQNATSLKATFNLTQPVAGWTQSNPSITVAPSSGSGEQYELAYETDNASTGAHAIVFETLDANGVPTAPPIIVTPSTVDVLGLLYILNSPVTPRAVATKLSSPVQAAVFQAIAQLEGDPTEFNTVMGEFVTGGSSGSRPAGSNASALASDTPTTVTIMFTPAGSNMTYLTPEIAALSNGDLVAVWDQIGPGDATWTVAGQIVTPGGVFVGTQFTMPTTLVAAATPVRPSIDALPNGDFVVVYSSAASSLSGQKYDETGNPIGNPFGVSNSNSGNAATTVLSDGTLLTLTGDGSNISAGTFAVQPTGATWSGASGTDMGTAGNWVPVALPDATETLTFDVGTAGTLTGSATGMNAVFGGAGAWLLQGATLSLAGETLSPNVVLALTDNAALNVSGGSLTAAGTIDIETTTGAAMTVLAGAHVSTVGLSLGVGGGQGGTLVADGAGTTIHNTGAATEIGGAGSGQISITGGASLTDTAGATLGLNGGGVGSLSLSGTGSSYTANGEVDVGVAGAGHLSAANHATVLTGGNAASPSQGFDIAELSGGSGDATITTNSVLFNNGRFVVGDAGLGSLSINAGGTVTTTPGAVAGLAGLVIANTAGASGSSVNVSGAGSHLNVTGSVIVGAGGAGALQISNGASAIADSLDIAAGGNGVVAVSGAGSTLSVTGSLIVGDQAAGELSILGGAQMTIGTGGVVGGTGANAAGNLDIEGVGSQLTINSGTLVVGANGPAEFTLGIGATLKGEVATSQFGVTNEYGNVDPATDPNDGTQNVGFGNSLLYDFFVANSGTIKITSGTATFYTPLVTDETNAQDGSTNGLWVIGAKDTLVMNATSVDNTQTFDFTSASAASLVIGQVPQGDINNLDTLNGATTPTLTGSIAPGAANVLPGWQAPIENYQSGDVIRLQGLTYGSATVSGDVVTVWSGAAGGGSALGSLVFIDKSDSTTSAAALASATAAQVQINSLACFAAGTRIETDDGWVHVEDLVVGDTVKTPLGGPGKIVWIGSRAVDCARHPRPETVWPVRISRGAFGDNVPVRDLYLSPDHAVFVNEVLVPVKLLINGTNIVQTPRDDVVYYHIELIEHAVILAEGLPVESYLDTGDRTNFDGSGTIRLFPDFATRLTPSVTLIWETRGAAPLVLGGPRLVAARQTVRQPPCRSDTVMAQLG